MTTPEGLNPGWLNLPAELRADVTSRLGAPVLMFEPATGVFAGIVGVVGTAGTQAFVKAVPSTSAAADDYRTEASVGHALPAAVRTPRLRFCIDRHGRVLLCFDALDGRHPSQPWRGSEHRSVFDTLSSCESALSSFDTSGLPTVADRMHGRCRTWGRLADAGSFGTLAVGDLSPWERLHLDRLAQVEAGWHRHIDGGTLLHFDLRFDNVMLTPPTRVWLLDWGRACRGPRWIDLVCLLLRSDIGSIDPEAAFLGHSDGRHAPPDAVDAFLVALASNWRHSAAQPVPTRFRQLQARRMRSRDRTLAWLSRRWR